MAWSSVKCDRMVEKEGHHLKTHHGISQVGSLQVQGSDGDPFSEGMGNLALGLILTQGDASGWSLQRVNLNTTPLWKPFMGSPWPVPAYAVPSAKMPLPNSSPNSCPLVHTLVLVACVEKSIL